MTGVAETAEAPESIVKIQRAVWAISPRHIFGYADLKRGTSHAVFRTKGEGTGSLCLQAAGRDSLPFRTGTDHGG